MKWKRRKRDDGNFDYVSGGYVCSPVYTSLSLCGDKPRAVCWSLTLDGVELPVRGAHMYATATLRECKFAASEHARRARRQR